MTSVLRIGPVRHRKKHHNRLILLEITRMVIFGCRLADAAAVTWLRNKALIKPTKSSGDKT
jgi:hypothetical protein